MSDTPRNINSRPRKSFPWGYLSLALIIPVILAYIGGKAYFCFFGIKPSNYRSTFYSWRLLHADPAMYSETWQHVMKNKYDVKDKESLLTRMVEIYQEGKRLLFTGHPEHYPRGQKGYLSHADYKFNTAFLNFRKKLCNAYDDKLPDDILSGKKTMGPSEHKYWNMRKGKDVSDYIKGENVIIKFMCGLTDIVVLLNNNKFKVAKDGVFDDDLVKKIVKLCKDNELQLETTKKGDKARTFTEVTDTMVKEVMKNFGKALSTTTASFAYSRVFYLIYLCTLNVDLDIYGELDKPKKNATKADEKVRLRKLNKLKDKGTARAEAVSKGLTWMVGSVFDGEYQEKRDNFFSKYILKPILMQSAKPVDMSKNNKIVVDELVRLFGENGMHRKEIEQAEE